MKKLLLLINAVIIGMSGASAIPLTKINQTIAGRTNGDMTLHILHKQSVDNASLKTTGLKKRFIGFGYVDNGVLKDSNRYYYFSNKRGSVHDDLTTYLEQYYPTSIDPINNIKCDSAERWSLQGGQLDQSEVRTFAYNSSNEVVQYTDQYNIAFPQYLYLISYNATGNISKVATNTKNGSTIINTHNMFVYYDAQNRRSYDSSYDVINAVPVNKRAFVYDANSNMVAFLSYVWKNNAWVLTYRVTHTYDGSNRLVTTIRALADVSNVLVNNTKDTFGYTGNSALYTYYKMYDWDVATNDWRYADKVTRTLNSQNLVASYILYANETNPLERIDAHYGTDDLLQYTESFKYTNGSFEATPYDKQTFYYEEYAPENINDIAAKAQALIIYPNPAIETVTVMMPQSEHAVLTVTDAAGKMMNVSQYAGGKEAVLDISHYASGLYHIRLADNNGMLIGQAQFQKL